MSTTVGPALFDVIADDASAESPLWAQALRPGGRSRRRYRCSRRWCVTRSCPSAWRRSTRAISSTTGAPGSSLPPDADTALLLGDYLYAHGLVRVAATGNVAAVHDLAELISLVAQCRAQGRPGDGAVWAATAALLGDGRLAEARGALREDGDDSVLDAAAREAAGNDAVARALVAHDVRVR